MKRTEILSSQHAINSKSAALMYDIYNYETFLCLTVGSTMLFVIGIQSVFAYKQ